MCVPKWEDHLHCTPVYHAVISSSIVGVRKAHLNLHGLHRLQSANTKPLLLRVRAPRIFVHRVSHLPSSSCRSSSMKMA